MIRLSGSGTAHTVRLSAGVRIVESEVRATRDSLEALEIFRRNQAAFDLVITDQTMPHMTGTELAKELAGLRSDIPIILCTGYSASKKNLRKSIEKLQKKS